MSTTNSTPNTDTDSLPQLHARLFAHAVHKPGSLGRLNIDTLLELVEEIRDELSDIHTERWTHRYHESIEVYDDDEEPPDNTQGEIAVDYTVQADSWDELSTRLQQDGHSSLINNLEIVLADDTRRVRIEIGSFQEPQHGRNPSFIVETEEGEENKLAIFAVKLFHTSRQKASRSSRLATTQWSVLGSLPLLVAIIVTNVAHQQGLRDAAMWNQIAGTIIFCVVALPVTALYGYSRIKRSQNCYVQANWPTIKRAHTAVGVHIRRSMRAAWEVLSTHTKPITTLASIGALIVAIIALAR